MRGVGKEIGIMKLNPAPLPPGHTEIGTETGTVKGSVNTAADAIEILVRI